MNSTSSDASAYPSFLPIELVLASPIDPLMDQTSSSDTTDPSLRLSPADIFRDEGEMMEEETESPVRRRAMNDQDDTTCPRDVNVEDARRVISPYPFSHTSQQEVEELEQLTNSCDWSLQQVQMDKKSNWGGKQISILVDYTRFLEFGEVAVDQVMDDDFSLSSREANSLSDDFCLSSISDNPASFWEECMDPILPDSTNP